MHVGGVTGRGPVLGDLIRRSREARHLSARALSAQADLSPSYVGKVEAGEIEPSLRAFARIAMALGLTSQEIRLCVLEASRTVTPAEYGEKPDED